VGRLVGSVIANICLADHRRAHHARPRQFGHLKARAPGGSTGTDVAGNTPEQRRWLEAAMAFS